MPQPTTLTEVLVKGRENIRSKGWCQNVYVDMHGHVCMLGALDFCTDDGLYCDASMALIDAACNYTGKEWLSVPTFNDMPGRTEEEVLTVFDKAIALVKEK